MLLLVRLKKYISQLLLVLMLINTLSSVVVISSFYANQDFFAENFCVNKAKPTLCAGSCYLTKVLENMPDQQDIPVELKISQISYEFILNQLVNINNQLSVSIIENNHFSNYTIFYKSLTQDLSAPPPKG